MDCDRQINAVSAGLVGIVFSAPGDCTPDALYNYDLDCNGQINSIDGGVVQSPFGTCQVPRDTCT